MNGISQSFFFFSDIYVDTVMLKYLIVLDGARVGISNYIGIVCESCAWTWILLVSKDFKEWSKALMQGGGVSNKWNITDFFYFSDIYADTVMLKYLIVLDEAKVGISNYIGLVCESCA